MGEARVGRTRQAPMVAAESPDVAAWFAEREQARARERWTEPGFGPDWETVLGAVLTLWGVLLTIGFVFELVFGIFVLSFHYAALIPWWFATLALQASGAWLAFELSEGEGLSVSAEWSPVSVA